MFIDRIFHRNQSFLHLADAQQVTNFLVNFVYCVLQYSLSSAMIHIPYIPSVTKFSFSVYKNLTFYSEKQAQIY